MKRQKSDCAKLTQCSAYVREWVAQQPSVFEESLSDWLLFEVSRQISRVHYKTFTRHQEGARTGADWEWWILFTNGSLKIRVQAKRFRPKTSPYSGISYPKSQGSQIRKLIRDAATENAIPLYVFYSSNEEACKCPFYQGGEGAFVADAKQILSDYILPQRRSVTESEILSESVPLSCLLCCDLLTGQTGTSSPRKFIEKYFPRSFSEGQIGIHEEFPDYVQEVISPESESPPNPISLREPPQGPGVSSLWVFDFREAASD